MSPTWKLEDTKALLSCGPLHGCVRPNHLVAGILNKTWHGQACDEFAVLQLVTPLVEDRPKPELLETYIRGHDLVASYRKVPPLTIAPQIYWRLKFDMRHEAVSVEIVLSVNTDLLDSQPLSAINSVGIDCEVLHSAALSAEGFKNVTSASGGKFEARESATNLFLMRNRRLQLSYAEIVHPDDFVRAEIDLRGEPFGSYLISSTLFPERLEKGVIRRARICGWFMPAENDLETAVQLAREFVDEPLPLTT